MMREATPSFPAHDVFIAVFSIGQLKSHRSPVITEPYEEILLM